MALINVRKKENENPFYYKGYVIPKNCFCDREKETKTLVDLVLNNNNIIMKSPRRLGKTSLLWHLFSQDGIKNTYNTIYLDIYPTKSVQNFIEAFYRSIQECPTIKNKKELDNLRRVLDEISLFAGLNKKGFKEKYIGIRPTAKFTYIQTEKSLEAVFGFLAKTSKPNLIVIDEFQQIKQYDETGIEASLRSFIQRNNNSNFIFSGSSRHLLAQIFDSPDKPFYRSCRTFNLDIIPYEAYADFCMGQFERKDRHIDEEAIKLTYHVFSGNTHYMQLSMNKLYSMMEPGETATETDMRQAIVEIVDEKDQDYATYMHDLKDSHERILCCVANESPCEEILSTEKRDRYGLPAASTTKNIIETFQNDKSRVIETIHPGVYRLEDRLLELWIAKNVFNNLDQKFNFAEASYRKECEIRKTPFKIQGLGI